MLIISSNASCSRHNIAEKMVHLSLGNTNPSLTKTNLTWCGKLESGREERRKGLES
jgi:hypothetical protein